MKYFKIYNIVIWGIRFFAKKFRFSQEKKIYGGTYSNLNLSHIYCVFFGCDEGELGTITGWSSALI